MYEKSKTFNLWQVKKRLFWKAVTQCLLGNLPMGCLFELNTHVLVENEGRFLKKQARKGFRPPSAMKGIGYFQNLRNLLRNFLEIFWILFWEFFGRSFWEDFLGGFFGGDFGRISLGGIQQKVIWIQKVLICLSRFWVKERKEKIEISRSVIASTSCLKRCRNPP